MKRNADSGWAALLRSFCSGRATGAPWKAPAESGSRTMLPGIGASLAIAGVAGAVALGYGADERSPAHFAAMITPGVTPLSPGQGRNDGLLLPVQDASEFAVANATGPVGQPLPLVIALPSEMPDSYAFLMFRGLPEQFALSAGFRTKDHWVLSLRDADKVKLLPPLGYEGLFAMEVLLMRGQDAPPERRVITVELEWPRPAATPETAGLPSAGQGGQLRATTAVERTASPQAAAPQAAAAPQPVQRQAALPPAAPQYALPPQPATPQPVPPQAMSDRDRSMLARAERLLREGDVAAARLLYGHLAQKGIAEGALAMARSYDPDVLVSLRIAGLEPDVTAAREWYQKAQALGSSQAGVRLDILGSGRR